MANMFVFGNYSTSSAASKTRVLAKGFRLKSKTFRSGLSFGLKL